MKSNEALAWFEEIAQTRISSQVRPNSRMMITGDPVIEYDSSEAMKWITTVDSAIKGVFPPGHAVIKRWEALLQSAPRVANWADRELVEGARAVFEAAREQLKQGRIAGLVDGIRAESVGELLDQAEALRAGGYRVAAVVIAGGALETFLKHLCDRNGLTWTGNGSITRYEQVLAQARNAGNEVISATYSKMVTGWGGMRNDAAHSPGQFNQGDDEVRLMIEGIRGFVARHT